MNVLILFNKIEDLTRKDQQDLLVQVDFVENILKQQGYKVSRLECDLNLTEIYKRLLAEKLDLVVNLVEELNNKGQFASFVPALLEEINIPFTGASSEVLYITTDKTLAKKFLKLQNLPTPDWYKLHLASSTFHSDVKYIIKPIYEDASFALSESSVIRPQNEAQLIAEIEKRESKYGCGFFAEQYIEGREFNVALIGNTGEPEILPIAEICFNIKNKPKILTYNAKWLENSEEYRNLVRKFEFGEADQHIIEKLRELSLKCWYAMNLNGYVRIDFRVDENDNLFILEINANPCLSPDAGFIAAALQNRFTATDVIMKLVNNAIEKK
jgi:D-alanine-D-alanine ligase